MLNVILKIIKDACKAVGRNIKNYIFLSVTIVISFSALGIYMIYDDSQIYNQYKDVMQVSSKMVFVEYDASEAAKAQLLKDKLDNMEESYYYTSRERVPVDMTSIWRIPSTSFFANIHYIPNEIWGYYYYTTRSVELLDGNKSMKVRDNEIIISKALYDLMKSKTDRDGNLYLKFPIFNEDGTVSYSQFLVTGVCNDFTPDPEVYTDGSTTVFDNFDVFMSEDLFNDMDTDSYENKLTIHTENPEKVIKFAQDLQLRVDSTYMDKSEMNENIINSIEIKKAIIIALLFLLGINLFSCFSNAMNERRFEIGVRRAAGASKLNIVMQFFVEGIVVMVTDIAIAWGVILMALSGIKAYNYYIYKQEWVINITSYAITMFAISCIFLSLFFSVVFAIMSTRVEIVKYLKGE